MRCGLVVRRDNKRAKWPSVGMDSIETKNIVAQDRFRSRIGAYRIIRRIGAGGMGEVFEASNDKIGRRVALKLLHQSAAQNRMARVRFETEARAANCVQHPCIVPITEIGQTDDGCRYLVMEYVDGETLRDAHRAEPGPWTELRILNLSVQLASALAAAHAKHMIHRDLKPANIMLLPEQDAPGGLRVKLLDFGIAKLASPDASFALKDASVTETDSRDDPQTRTGAILGTPLYMSPEQCRDSSGVTAGTDVYSLGVILYELLVGQPPFVGESDVMLLLRHVEETERPIRERVASASPDLTALVHRMLRKPPTERPTMLEVEQRMRALLESYVAVHRMPAILPRPVASELPVQKQPRERQRHRWQIAVFAGILVLLAAGWWGVHHIRREQRSIPISDAMQPRMDAKEAPASQEIKNSRPHSEPEDQAGSERPRAPMARQLLGPDSTAQPTPQHRVPASANTKKGPRVPSSKKVSDAPKPHVELIRD